MLDFHPLTAKELLKVGIVFETKEEGESFARTVQEELEVRIGGKISEGKSKEQLAEFDKCHTSLESKRWLRDNCPEYKEIVIHLTKQMEKELIEYRNDIPGTISNANLRSTSIAELKLSFPIFDVLQRENLLVVSDVLYADLEKILRLNDVQREEIREKLWRFFYPTEKNGESNNDKGLEDSSEVSFEAMLRDSRKT